MPDVMAIGGNSTRNSCTREAQSIRQNPQRRRHESTHFLGFTVGTLLASGFRVTSAARALTRAASDDAIVRSQAPVRLDVYYEPEPDLALLRPRDDFYASRHPGPGDVLLIVEIADSSIGYDREVKASAYAMSGIPE